jgi:hypothetical protein
MPRLFNHRSPNRIAHQDISMQAQFVLEGAGGQQVDEMAAVVIIEKNGAPIDASLRDMQRDSRNFQARLTRH